MHRHVNKPPLQVPLRFLPVLGALRVTALLMTGAIFFAHAAPAQHSAQAAKVATAKTTASSRPYWRDLTAEQQKTLGPLSALWDTLPELQKRKWLIISRNQARLSPEERAVQHGRMTEWASLSRQQREQARFNFDEVKQVPAAERKAKWEAYQALSIEEKRRLADAAAKRPKGAAGTIRPVSPEKLAPVPATRENGRPGPRIELAPSNFGTVPPPYPAAPSAAAIRSASPMKPQDDPQQVPVVPLLPN